MLIEEIGEALALASRVSLGINIFPLIGNAAQNSYRLALTPDATRCRVGNAISTLTAGINPFGQVITGGLLQLSRNRAFEIAARSMSRESIQIRGQVRLSTLL